MTIQDTVTTADNQRIAVELYKTGHDKCVFIAHGFFNSKDAVVLKNVAEELQGQYDVVMFDFRGQRAGRTLSICAG